MNGLLPEGGPLQPPEPRLTLVQMPDLTRAQKLDVIRKRLVKRPDWARTVAEAIPEAADKDYHLFLQAVLVGNETLALDLAREMIVNHVEGTLAQRCEDWEDYT